jgi:glycosyltransferase involved in cell wall biosynthesis
MRSRINKTPTVSAVIPAFNYGRYLVEAINSVFAQTYPVFEIFLVDDGSTDNTPEIAALYGERIRYIRTGNRGVSAARNAAIAIAKGDLIALLDADDRWLPHKLERQIARLNGDSSIGLVHSASRIFDSDTNATLCEIFPEEQIGFHDIVKWNGISLPSALVPRRVFDDVGGFNEARQSAADWDMWIRIAAKYQLVSCLETLVDYRMHGNNMSGNAIQPYIDCMAVLDDAEQMHPGCEACRIAIRSARRRVREVYYDKASALAREHLRNERYLQGLKWRLRSVVRYPHILLQALRIMPSRVAANGKGGVQQSAAVGSGEQRSSMGTT